ncbi:MAG: hypothetical protein OEW00_15085 [candidate division Zixibacteria bacterium]|nr:hypothetical protein [candidate division Zixibacteria bacterium]
MKSNLKLDFLDRTLRTTGVVLLIFLPVGLYYFGVYPTLAVFSGGVWGIVNFIFVSALIRTTIRPGGADKARAVALALVKFPLLYASGYFLLKVPQFEPLHLMVGFSSLFGVLVLKALGRLYLALDDKLQREEGLQKAR